MNLHMNEHNIPVSLKILNEQQKVYKGVIVLNEIPDEYYKVIIDGMTEVEEIKNEKQYKVDYTYGKIYVHSSIADNTEIVIKEYYGRGYVLIPSSRIYTSIKADGSPETMDEFLESSKPFVYRGIWDATVQYKANNQVYYNGNTYICLNDCSNVKPDNISFWRIFAAGLKWQGKYDAKKQYYERDIVNVDDFKVFMCKKDSLGNATSNTDYWEPMIDLSAAYEQYNKLINLASQKIEELDGLVSDYNTNLKDAVVAATNNANEKAELAQTATDACNNAIADYDEVVYQSIEIAKEPVLNYDDLSSTYPTPKNGWTVKILNDGKTYRYDGKKKEWVWINTSSSDGHIHVNKEVLDNLTDNSGSLQYKGKDIIGHIHNNKTVIDKFTETTDGKLQFNGKEINSDSSEIAKAVLDYGTNAGNKFVTLTLAEYDALAAKDPNTIYLITDDNNDGGSSGGSNGGNSDTAKRIVNSNPKDPIEELSIWVGTQAEFNAITEKDNLVLYVVTDASNSSGGGGTSGDAITLNGKTEDQLEVRHAVSAESAKTAESADSATKAVSATTADNALKLNNKVEAELEVKKATTADNATKLDGKVVGGSNGIATYDSLGMMSYDKTIKGWSTGTKDNILFMDRDLPAGMVGSYKNIILGTNHFQSVPSGQDLKAEGFLNVLGSNICTNGVYGTVTNSTLLGLGTGSGNTSDEKREISIQGSFLYGTPVNGSLLNQCIILGSGFSGRQRKTWTPKNYYNAENCIGLGGGIYESSDTTSGEIMARYVTCLGYGSTFTGSNQVQLGGSGTNVYGWSSYNSRSDARDKTDITELKYDAVQFIKALKPRNYKYDYRSDYHEKKELTQDEYDALSEEDKQYVYKEDNGRLIFERELPKDGSKKGNRDHNGFIAQEVKEAADSLGFDFAGYQDHKINGGADVYTLGYTEFIAPMVATIQVLLNKVETLEKELKEVKTNG